MIIYYDSWKLFQFDNINSWLIEKFMYDFNNIKNYEEQFISLKLVWKIGVRLI